MKLTLLIAVVGFSSFSAWADLNNQDRYEPNYSDTVLDNKKCSGHISDLNCYADIIQKEAHRANVRDGYVQPNSNDLRQFGPIVSPPLKKKVYQGRKILIDTEDRQSCEEVRDFVKMTGASRAGNTIEIGSLCEPGRERYREVTIMGETYEEYLTPIKAKFFKNTMDTLGVDTRNLTNLLIGGIGVLWVLPESVSKWDREEIKATGLLNKWKKNVKEGPVWDEDDPVINYVGHPLSGAAYYTVARTNGASPLASFGYSVLISTFFWEYGFEAFAEIPSIQDLILTPVIGSILGEVFYRWQEKIKTNGGKVLGSDRLGSVALFLLNPATHISNSINKVIGAKIIQNSETNLVISRRPVLDIPGQRSNYIGIEMKFKF